MRLVTLSEILEMAKKSTAKKIYIHWTAGHYQQTFNDYHFNITGDGAIYTDVFNLDVILSHTYRRNTGAIGIALCCAYKAHSMDNLGPEPPTDIQIEVLAEVIAALAEVLDIPIDIQHVMTHAEAADNMDGKDYGYEPYGPNSTVERWDAWVLKEGDEPGSGGDIIRGKVIFYYNQRKGV